MIQYTAVLKWMVTVLTLFVWVLPAHGQNLVVFEAVGTAHQPGDILDGKAPLVLTVGQRLALIADDGRMVHLEGPHDQPPMADSPDKAQPSMKQALQMLVQASSTMDSGAAGAMRSADEALNMTADQQWLPDPWLVNAETSGPQCLRSGEHLLLWRSQGEKESKVAVRTPAGRWWDAVWPAGKSKLMAPAEITLTDGEVLEITLDDTVVQVNLNIIPETVTSSLMQAAWLKEKGCRQQFLAMVRHLGE